MLEILGRLIGSFFHTLFQVAWGAVWVIPFAFAGGVATYGYFTDNVLVLMAGAALTLFVVLVCGGIATLVKG